MENPTVRRKFLEEEIGEHKFQYNFYLVVGVGAVLLICTLFYYMYKKFKSGLINDGFGFLAIILFVGFFSSILVWLGLSVNTEKINDLKQELNELQ